MVRNKTTSVITSQNCYNYAMQPTFAVTTICFPVYVHSNSFMLHVSAAFYTVYSGLAVPLYCSRFK